MRCSTWPRLSPFVVGLAACGPDLVASDGSTTDHGRSTGSPTSSISDSDGADDTTPISSSSETAGPPPEPDWCLRGEPQQDLDGDSTPLAIQDTDGNGRDELWMVEALEDPVTGQQSSRLLAYELDASGQFALIVDLERPGAARTMVDIDGDGLRDVLMSQRDPPEDWWLAGLSGPSVDETVNPLAPLSDLGAFVDADGDGRVDLFERNGDTFTLRMGDGAGGFTTTDTLLRRVGLDSVAVWPTGIPGTLVARPRGVVIGFGNNRDQLLALGVSPQGRITTLATSDPLDIEIAHIRDLDDDGIPDVLGFDDWERDQGLLTVRQGAPGMYTLQEGDMLVHGLLVDPLTAEDALDVLHWTDDPDEIWLRRYQDPMSAARPVTVEGPWSSNSRLETIQADGIAGREILQRTVQDEAHIHALWRLEPCEE